MNAKETLTCRAAARIRRQARPRRDVDKTKPRSLGSWPQLRKRRLTTLFCFIFLTFLVVASVFAGAENLILNPGAEQGENSPQFWSINGVGYWSSDGHTGIHALGINAAGSDGWNIADKFLVNENSTYTFSFWVKGTYTSGDFFVQLRWFTAADVWLGQTVFRIAATYSTWQLVNETVTPLVGAAKGNIMLCGFNTPNGDVLGDDFSLTEIRATPSEAATWIEEMLFGSGFWLFIIIILAIVFATVWAVPYSGTIFLPVCVFLAIEYFGKLEMSSNHMWGAILMLFASVYVIVVMAMKIRSK